MVIKSFYATKTFKLVIDFETETRVIDIKKVNNLDYLLLKEVSENLDLFVSAEIDESKEELCWRNGLRITLNHLYQESKNLEDLLDPPRKKFVRPLQVTVFKGETKIEKNNKAMLEKIKSLRYK